MVTIGLVFVALAALIHVYIFVLESLRFDQPSTWRVFGVKGAAAYRIGGDEFCALVHGLADDGSTAGAWGRALAVYCCAFMLAAALVLIASDRRKARAALVQGAAPALALVFLVLG